MGASRLYGIRNGKIIRTSDPKATPTKVLDSVLRSVIDNENYYEGLYNRPARLRASMLILFMKGECSSPRAILIRDAEKFLEEKGHLTTWDPEANGG